MPNYSSENSSTLHTYQPEIITKRMVGECSSVSPLSKRRENARLILFYKIINNLNLAMVPHLCLEKADGRTRKNHNLKFRHIGYNVAQCAQKWKKLKWTISYFLTFGGFIW